MFLFTEDISSQSSVDSIDEVPNQEEVSMQGKVLSTHSSEKVQFVKLTGQKEITTEIIIFNDEPLFIQAGDIIEVKGLVESYKGKKEIIASKVMIKGREN